MYLVTGDFTGKYAIATDDLTETDLEACIEENEVVYLRDLLGDTLYKLFYADLSAGPALPLQSQRFLNIYNAFSYDSNLTSGDGILSGFNQEPKIVVSQGMKEMLKGFVFFEYNTLQPVQNSLIGNVENVSENATRLSMFKAGIKEKYNMAIVNYNAIQSYIKKNRSVYPEFNGICKKIINVGG